jgi:hypothetical protein
MNDSVSPETLRHIRTLEWLTFDQQLYADAITQTNVMIRHFLGLHTLLMHYIPTFNG